MKSLKWIMIAVLVVGFGIWLKTPSRAKVAVLNNVEAGFTYSMPKSRTIHSMGAGYDVQEESDLVDNDSSEQKDDKKDDKSGKKIAKKDDKKAKEDKAKKDKAKKLADAKKKKKKVTVNVVSKDSKTLQFDNETSEDPLVAYNDYVPVVRIQKAPVAAVKKEEEKKVMTETEWKALFASEPTVANMQKFLSALAAGDVSRAFYYEMIGQLLAEQKPETQQLAIDALKVDRSATTFRWLATNFDKFAMPLQPAIKEILTGYAEIGKLVALSQVLQSKDKISVTLALEILQQKIATLPVVAAVETEEEPGRGREPSAQVTTTRSSYMFLVSSLQGLVESEEADIAALAQAVLNLLTAQA